MTDTGRPAESPPVGSVRGRIGTVLIWVLVSPAALGAAVRLSGSERGRLVQVLAFTPYLAAWSVVPVLIALAARHRAALVVAVTAAALLGVAVLPRALPARGPAGGVALPVMTANLWFGNADPATIVELVHDHRVAVLGLQEFTPQARDALAAAGLGALLPYSSLAPEPGPSGSAVYSRFPITGPGARRNDGGFLQAYGTIQPPGAGPVTIESVHPLAPTVPRTFPVWRADLAAQPPPDPAGTPRILVGDFNATLDHPSLRRLIARGYRDAADASGTGLAGTWGPYDGDPIPPVALDHVLVDQRIGVRDLAVRPLAGTDHRALLAWLAVPPGSP